MLQKSMRIYRALSFSIVLFAFCACDKTTTDPASACNASAATVRTISSKKATVKVTNTATYPVYLVEEGTIDTKLIPCNFPSDASFYKNDIQVTISGDVKEMDTQAYGPCCANSFVISSISK